MKLRDKILFVLSGMICFAFFNACSTKKNTASTRAYHSFTTRYNVFFNANESYKENLKTKQESFQDNFSELLPFYPEKPLLEPKKESGGAFDRTIEKTTKAIQLHSITAKPPRNPAKRGDAAYKAWVKQGEFNPFLENAWLLMGKAQVQNQDYTDAVSTFSHIVRLYANKPEIVSEAQLWMMRAYTEMGWFFEAEDVANSLKNNSLSKSLQKEFTENYAHLLLAKKSYPEATSYLQQAIDNQSNYRQKMRLQYLLGQVYNLLGEKENAYHAFEKVQGMRTPYDLTFNAIIRQSEVYAGANKNEVIEKLRKMAKSSKNKEYLDQIYYAIGNIYMAQSDTTKAIENYLLAEKESTRNGFEKALAQVALGDLYFEKKDYPEADPRYTGALSALPQYNEHYPRVSFRSGVLKELVPHVVAVETQDSLQHLAQLPEAERLKIIKTHIAALKKREKELKNDAEREAYLAEQQGRVEQLGQSTSAAEAAASMASRTGESSFYFYNMQLVAQGKSTFQQRWGNRKLEDNWRLRNKVSGNNIDFAANTQPVDTDNTTSENIKPDSQTTASTDPYSVDFYLQQLPTTPQKLEASNAILEKGLFDMATIIKDDLNDYTYAISIYNRLLKDFPQSIFNKEIYHHLHLIYTRVGNRTLAQTYKNKLIATFPESDIAIAMRDPRYEWNMQHFAQVQDSLYQQAYSAYKSGKTNIVRDLYQEVKKKLPQSDFLPKFALLNALSYVRTGEQDNFKQSLTELVANHPNTDAATLAQEMLAGIAEGKLIATDSHAMSDINWNTASQAAAVDTSLIFSNEKRVPHLYLLIYQRGAVKKNELLFAVANFNFSNFKLRAFDLSFMDIAPMELMQVKGFKSFSEAQAYANMAQNDSILTHTVSADVTPIIISETNFEILSSGKSLSEYIAFYEENFAEMPEEFIAEEKLPESKNEATLQKATEQTKPKAFEEKQEKVIHERVESYIEDITADSIQPINQIEIDKKQLSDDDLLKAAKQKAEAAAKSRAQQDILQRQKEKQAQLQQKAAKALQKAEEQGEQKSREQLIKEREKERKEQMKKRERELKKREKARKAELKQRERERKKILKKRERERKKRLKELERQRKNRDNNKNRR